MKQARSRAKSGGGVKEIKTLAALQQELKVRATRAEPLALMRHAFLTLCA